MYLWCYIRSWNLRDVAYLISYFSGNPNFKQFHSSTKSYLTSYLKNLFEVSPIRVQDRETENASSEVSLPCLLRKILKWVSFLLSSVSYLAWFSLGHKVRNRPIILSYSQNIDPSRSKLFFRHISSISWISYTTSLYLGDWRFFMGILVMTTYDVENTRN